MPHSLLGAALHLGVFCCAFVCGGCVIITSGYPKGWSPAEHKTGSCDHELTGIYAMVGEDFTNGSLFFKSSSEVARLDKYLMPDMASESDRIEIFGPLEGRLVFTALRGDTPISQRTLTEHKDYECKEDGVSLKENQLHHWYDQNSGFYSWSSERYWHASDGALIIRRTGRGFGAALYIPVFGASEDWSRFPVPPAQ